LCLLVCLTFEQIIIFKTKLAANCWQKKNVNNDVGKRNQSAGTAKSTSKQLIGKLKPDVEAGSEMDEATTATCEIKFTLKQLIRKLHIVEPVENVMCLIGKRLVLTIVLYCKVVVSK